MDGATPSTAEIMAGIGRAARASERALALATAERKHAALVGMAEALGQSTDAILDGNAIDVETAREAGVADAFIDRLRLDKDRIRGIANAVLAIAEMPDPIGAVTANWTRPNGLDISRVRTPLGVIGVIYESRPNVTADAGALCLKAGNPVILRGGSDSAHSARAIHAAMVKGLMSAGLPNEAVQLVPTTDRAAVGAMLAGLDGNLDVIVPRGGRSLVERVQAEARVPVFAHLEGLCHIYVDKAADVAMAREIVVNAKLRRTGICGAAETLLVDAAGAKTHLAPLVKALLEAGCEVRGDAAVHASDERVVAASDADWATEYLAPIISARVVDGVGGAIAHIAQWSSNHTECVITDDEAVAAQFLAEVDSAIVMHNASTQFADGGEFGMGGEIGIATGRMHARGPVGVEQLTSFKYVVRGQGQVRPA